jgi:hypothetical protein
MTRILKWLIAIPLALVPAVASAHVGVVIRMALSMASHIH